MLKITTGYNKDRDLIQGIKRSGLPVILYGVGLIADNAEIMLQENGLGVASRVIDDKYLDSVPVSERNSCVLSISQLERQYKAYNLLLCFFGGYRSDLQTYRDLFPGANILDFLSSIYDRGVLETMDTSYITDHLDAFEKVYDLLEDRLSRDSMEAYLNAKINRDASFLFPYVRRPQYFSGSDRVQDLKLRKDEILINCGAFTGDTIKDFLVAVDNNFQKIYACEPDPVNVQHLTDFIKSMGIGDRTQIIPKCISDKRENVFFLCRGNMLSRKVEEQQPGTVLIQADTIDNLLGSRPVSLIVMDVEGNELKALQGARDTILKHKPLLAVAAYHKKDDLITLTGYLKELVAEYRFYFRVHKPMAIDAVLYASTRAATCP